MNFQGDGRNEYVAAVIPSHSNPLTYLSLAHKAWAGDRMWGFPGGKPVEGEILIEALKRELWEELNIEPIAPQLIGQWTRLNRSTGMTWVGNFYLVNAYSGIPAIQEEKKHSKLTYLNLHELIVGNCDPEFRAVAHLELKSFSGE